MHSNSRSNGCLKTLGGAHVKVNMRGYHEIFRDFRLRSRAPIFRQQTRSGSLLVETLQKFSNEID